MTLRGKSVLAVVPARGGSKGIPRKNLRQIAGLSLVARAAAAAAAVGAIDARILSTDDQEIADEGLRHGLEVPFVRPPELSSDTAGSVETWRHAWLAAETHFSRRFDVSVLLEPTSPMRMPEDIERTLVALLDSGAGAAATVSPTPAHYTPHKTLTVDGKGRLGFYLQAGAGHSRRQSIPQYYHRNGLCYAVTREQLVDRGWIIDDNAVAVVVERHVVNIDELYELELAAWLLNREAQHA